MNASKIKTSYSKFVAYLGFTLVELMVTLVVLGIIASIAAPSISEQLANQRVKSTTATLMSVLKEARTESNINKIPVTVSYINGNQSNNIINVEVPYSGPTMTSSMTATQDWTNLFMKSALASAPRPSGGGSGGTGSGGTGSGGTGSGGTDSGGTGTGGTGSGGTGSGGTDSGGTGTGGTGSGGTDSGGTGSGGTGSGGTGSGGTGTGTGGTGTGGTGTGGTGTENGSETGTGETDNPEETNLVIIATYPYNVKSSISSLPSTNKIVFRPNGTVNKEVVYTICDSNRSAVPRQVSVSHMGLISSKLGGNCE